MFGVYTHGRRTNIRVNEEVDINYRSVSQDVNSGLQAGGGSKPSIGHNTSSLTTAAWLAYTL